MNNILSRVIPCYRKTCLSHSETKFNGKFQFKDHIEKDHQHDAAYYVKCPEEE